MGDDIEKLIERAKAHQAGMRPSDPQLVSDLLAALEEWKSAAEDELRRRRNLAASLLAAEAERDCACKDAQAERFHLLQAEAERDEAIKARNEAVRLMCETSSKLGEMEGKYKAAHWPGIVDGWIERCKAAEAQVGSLTAERDTYKRALPDCETCGGTGYIIHPATLTGRNVHSACRGPCDACDGLGVEL